MSKRIRVISSIFKPPLLDTDQAAVVEFYDEQGNLEALLSRVLEDTYWAFSSRKDPDWQETLVRHGYLDMGKRTVKELRHE